MLKEIHEQPAVAGELLHLLNRSPHVERFLEALNASDDRPVFLVGCGTSYHACLLGAYFFDQIAGKPAVPVLGPQFIEQYGRSTSSADTAVFVSQSGETKDILNAIKVMRRRGGRVLGILNVLGSSLAHQSDVYLPLACGYEISVPATKTFVNQAVLFLYLAYRLAGRDTAELDRLPDLLARTLEATEEPAHRVAGYLEDWTTLHYLGYGLTHPIALEAALKLKEITYAHCEGMFSSEFKHGPLSAVHPGYPVLFLTAPGDEAMMINHVNEVTTRGGRAIALAAEHPALRANVHDYSGAQLGSLPIANPAYAAGPTGCLPPQRSAGHRSRFSSESEQDVNRGLAVIWLWVSIIIITLVGVAVGRYPWLRMNRATIALVGATALIILGAISLEEAYAALDLNTLTLLLAMMILNVNLRLAGFFGSSAAGWSGGHERRECSWR